MISGTCYNKRMTRAALHHLIDELPDTDVAHVAALVEAARNHDRLVVQSLLAEEVVAEDDEIAALDELDRNEPTIPLEDLERRYGFL